MTSRIRAVKICEEFMNNNKNCKFGNTCWNIHPVYESLVKEYETKGKAHNVPLCKHFYSGLCEYSSTCYKLHIIDERMQSAARNTQEEIARITFEKTGDEIDACAAAKVHEIKIRSAITQVKECAEKINNITLKKTAIVERKKEVAALEKAASQTADKKEESLRKLKLERCEPPGMSIFMKEYYNKIGDMVDEIYVLQHAKDFLISLGQDTKEVLAKICENCNRIVATIKLIQPTYRPEHRLIYKDLYPITIQIIRESIIHKAKLASFSKKTKMKNFDLIAHEIDLRFQKAVKILDGEK